MTSQRLELTWYNKNQALITAKTGKYGYIWTDPADPRYCETHTLVYGEYVKGTQSERVEGTTYSQRADLPPQDDNLLILGESGDVLEALTRVPELAEKYVGKVKLVYIDPPFNTSHAFEHYEDNLEHSIWLTLMRDRLVHLRTLLSDEGSIWVHLDDGEVHRMRVLLDEIFGAGNFVADLSVEINPKGRQLDRFFAQSHDRILVYAKSLPECAIESSSADEVNWDDFPKRLVDGTPYRYLPLRNTNKRFNPQTNPTLYYPLYGNPEMGEVKLESEPGFEEIYPVFGDGKPAVWRWGKDGDAMNLSMLRARRIKGALGERVDIFQIDTANKTRTKKYQTIWLSEGIGSSDSAKREMRTLFPDKQSFSTPKPEQLLERIIDVGTEPGDVVVDVFGGSGTTAAVAQKMGRRWVTCELLESTFNTYTLPRLKRVVKNEDFGGITYKKTQRIAATGVELPEGVSPEDAAKFVQILNKLIKDEPELKKAKSIKTLKAIVKTKRATSTVNWRGGGGFQVAYLSSSCFDYDSELDCVLLTKAAEGRTLVEAVAANLGFKLLPQDGENVFDGRLGNSYLKVFDGVGTTKIVDWLICKLQEDETLVLAVTGIMDGVREHLRKARRGSRIVVLPDDLFAYSQEGTIR